VCGKRVGFAEEEETYISWCLVALEVGLDRLVLLVELGEVGYEVLDDVGVWERVDARLSLGVGWDAAQAGQSVDTVDVHRAAAADTLSAAPSESQGRVDLVLDSDQSIQHHGTRLVQVEGVALHPWLGCWLVWVPSVDVEGLDLGVLVWYGLLDGRGLTFWDRWSRRSHGLSDAGDGLDCGCHSTDISERPWSKARGSNSERCHCDV